MKTREELEVFIQEAQKNGWCVPPPHEIQQAHHYWVMYDPRQHGSADSPSYMVVQWAPGTLEWYRSNEVATCRPPLLDVRIGWCLVERIELPSLEKISSVLSTHTPNEKIKTIRKATGLSITRDSLEREAMKKPSRVAYRKTPDGKYLSVKYHPENTMVHSSWDWTFNGLHVTTSEVDRICRELSLGEN